MHRVLVVDDEEPILELLRYNLEKSGYEVKTALDGSRAVDIARKFIPDLVLLDIMMPKMDGVETCRLLRDIPLWTSLRAQTNAPHPVVESPLPSAAALGTTAFLGLQYRKE